MLGSNQVEITCLEKPYYILKFPMQTSDLLLVLSAMLTGKVIAQDDINFRIRFRGTSFDGRPML